MTSTFGVRHDRLAAQHGGYRFAARYGIQEDRFGELGGRVATTLLATSNHPARFVQPAREVIGTTLAPG